MKAYEGIRTSSTECEDLCGPGVTETPPANDHHQCGQSTPSSRPPLPTSPPLSATATPATGDGAEANALNPVHDLGFDGPAGLDQAGGIEMFFSQSIWPESVLLGLVGQWMEARGLLILGLCSGCMIRNLSSSRGLLDWAVVLLLKYSVVRPFSSYPTCEIATQKTARFPRLGPRLSISSRATLRLSRPRCWYKMGLISSFGMAGNCCSHTAEPKIMRSPNLSASQVLGSRHRKRGGCKGRLIEPTLFPSELFPHQARSHTISAVVQAGLHEITQIGRFQSPRQCQCLCIRARAVSPPDVLESFVRFVVHYLDSPRCGMRRDCECISSSILQ